MAEATFIWNANVAGGTKLTVHVIDAPTSAAGGAKVKRLVFRLETPRGEVDISPEEVQALMAMRMASDDRSINPMLTKNEKNES
jgi:hypothetical protein